MSLSAKFHFISFLVRYGLAQSQYLPTGDFEFVDDVTLEEILLTPSDSDTGFIVEVDLEYPEYLHKDHREFPLAPEQITITPEMLSSYARKCSDVLGTKLKKETKKLSSTFNTRKNYVLHYENLKLYTRLGMKVGKMHKVLQFSQSPFLKKYIDFCTEMRSLSRTDFAKRLFKLMANAVYGKTIEQALNRLDVKFARSSAQMRVLAARPNFSNFVTISKNLVAVFFKKKNVVIKQPYAVGFTILERSKHFMYESFYDHFKPAFGPDMKVLFSDTDSLFISVPFSKNPHKKIRHILDTSNFPPSHKLYSPDRKAQLGYFKSETGATKVTKFLGIRAKCYAFKTEDSTIKKCKGIAKAFRKKIPFEAFERCLAEISSQRATQYTISSKSHNVRVMKQSKLAFSSFDDKRYLLPCGIHSVPYGSEEITYNKFYCSFCSN